MQVDFSFSTNALMIAALAALLFLAGFILIYRYLLAKRALRGYETERAKKEETSVLLQRNKYPGADVFRHSPRFFLTGLAMTLILCIFAFNWTIFEQKIYIPDDALVLEEDIELEPPRSAEPPPPPPPPPPPVIEEVPNELMDEEDEVEFLDQSVSAETEVLAEPVKETVKKEIAPPPPPPPPPVSEEEEIFMVVEQMPMFPGCENESDVNLRRECSNRKLLEFIYKNIKYPPVARDNNIQGTVVVKFVVDENGRISSPTLIKDIGGNCGQEALRVVNLMNEQNMIWEAGKQRGRPVKVWFMLPVKFQLV